MSTHSPSVPSCLIVGAGPGGLAPVLAAAFDGCLPELLEGGVTIVERGDAVGSGGLGQYAISSDSAAEAFLDIITRTTEPRLRALLESALAAVIAQSTGDAIPLTQAGEFLSLVGQTICKVVDDSPNGTVLRRHTALFTQRVAPGLWSTRVRCETTGKERSLLSRSVIIATGARQPESRLRTEKVAGTHLLPLYQHKLVQTGEIFTPAGMESLRQRLAAIENPRVVVVGGSTSAGAAARLLLHQMPELTFSEAGVTMMHRAPLRIFYRTAEEALAEGYTDFGPRDICPVSGRVYRLAGFRLDTREMIMGALGVGGRPFDPRLRLHLLMESSWPDARRLLDEADVIVAGLGYRPFALPVFSEDNERVPLRAESDRMVPMVDNDCRILDAQGLPLEGIYGIGLASGFVPHGALGGEESFTGQANSLWLWQHDLGLKIANSVLARAAAATGEAPSTDHAIDDQGELAKIA